MIRRPPRSTLFPYRRSSDLVAVITTIANAVERRFRWSNQIVRNAPAATGATAHQSAGVVEVLDRKSTRLNSSHTVISYAVFCLKKKKNDTTTLHRTISQTSR